MFSENRLHQLCPRKPSLTSAGGIALGDLQNRHGHLLRGVSAAGFAERQWFRPGPGPRRPFPRRIRVPNRIRCRSRTCNFSECTRSGVCRELRCRQLRSFTYGPLRIRAPSRLQLVAEAARFKAPGFVCGDRRRLLQVLLDEGAAKTPVETAWINTPGLIQADLFIAQLA
jgi:hypothetical protein